MNYNESDVSGTQWTRCYHVECRNPVNGTKQIIFSEEQAANLDGNIISTGQGERLFVPFKDPTASFDLIHPETGEVIGTATHQDLYVMLSSAYLSEAKKRDIANEQQEEW